MPRQKTEAAAYLDIYKVVTEQKRLEQELEVLEQRRDRILQRLQVLEVQAQTLEASAHQLRDGDGVSLPPALRPSPVVDDGFNPLVLEY
jgi:hypothetical protein